MEIFDRLTIEDVQFEDELPESLGEPDTIPASIFEANTVPFIPLHLIGDEDEDDDDDFPW